MFCLLKRVIFHARNLCEHHLQEILVLERMNYQTNVKEQSKTSHLFDSFSLDSYIQDA
jgi:hypothetical protein